jgi:hypothetical protein
MLEDRDTAFYLGSILLQPSSGNFLVYVDKVDATYTRDGAIGATAPFTWGTNDRIYLAGSYEAN